MLALIAGQGHLPVALAEAFVSRGDPFLLCEMAESSNDVPDVSDGPERIAFRIEQLGSFLNDLRARGVTRIAMAGAVTRPPVDPGAIDAATLPLVPRIQAAIASGDDGALRAVIAIFEEQGFEVLSAHALCPDLLPLHGILSRAQPAPLVDEALPLAAAALADMGALDMGQSTIVSPDGTVFKEGPEGTDALIAASAPCPGGVLFKAPKPGQDRRADLPAIGVGTARAAAAAGLAGIVIEAGGVMILERDAAIAACDDAGLFLWVREAWV